MACKTLLQGLTAAWEGKPQDTLALSTTHDDIQQGSASVGNMQPQESLAVDEIEQPVRGLHWKDLSCAR